VIGSGLKTNLLRLWCGEFGPGNAGKLGVGCGSGSVTRRMSQWVSNIPRHSAWRHSQIGSGKLTANGFYGLSPLRERLTPQSYAV